MTRVAGRGYDDGAELVGNEVALSTGRIEGGDDGQTLRGRGPHRSCRSRGRRGVGDELGVAGARPPQQARRRDRRWRGSPIPIWIGDEEGSLQEEAPPFLREDPRGLGREANLSGEAGRPPTGRKGGGGRRRTRGGGGRGRRAWELHVLAPAVLTEQFYLFLPTNISS